jgi:hypothetical protein
LKLFHEPHFAGQAARQVAESPVERAGRLGGFAEEAGHLAELMGKGRFGTFIH